eukprot:2688145-Pleurochrysis_carterae.AAC.2
MPDFATSAEIVHYSFLKLKKPKRHWSTGAWWQPMVATFFRLKPYGKTTTQSINVRRVVELQDRKPFNDRTSAFTYKAADGATMELGMAEASLPRESFN